MAYLSSLFSGTRTSFPQELCVSQALYEEANARILYDMYNMPNAWRGVDAYDFDVHITSLTQRGDMAKVIVDRKADVMTNSTQFDGLDDINTISYGAAEGYLLKKEGGQWKIYNIIFVTDFLTETFTSFKNDHNPTHWQEKYSFENCSRKHYEDNRNYSDYLIGNIENGTMNTSLMHIDIK